MNVRCKYKSYLINGVILAVSILMLFPLFWMLITSMKSQADVLKNPLSLFPWPNMFFNNVRTVMSRADWLIYYKNSLILCLSVWAVQMLIAIPAGFAFGTMRFRGGKLLFLLILTRLLVSPESTMLANYMTVLKIGAYDSIAGIVLPYAVSAQAVFMFREAFKQIPPSFRESARMDGCGDFQYVIRIGIPVIMPYIISFSIITFVFQWNAFFWPMLITTSPSNRIVAVGLTFFGMQAESGAEWALTMSATLMVITPLLAVFLIFQKRFINIFADSGVKSGIDREK